MSAVMMFMTGMTGLVVLLAVGPQSVLGDFALSNSRSCPSGYSRVYQHSSLNGDLNQGAGGKDIFLCTLYTDIAYLSHVRACPSGYSRVYQHSSLNGDLNQGAGGKDIFLCTLYTDIAYLSHVRACPSGYSRVYQPSSLNGDLNEGAGGKDIFLCETREFTQMSVDSSPLVSSPPPPRTDIQKKPHVTA